MSTLTEIEAAVETLPDAEKEQLLRKLAMGLRQRRSTPEQRIFSGEEIAAMIAEDEAGGEHFRLNELS